jgi:anti-sigma regulatory factor (Ser/Thr protein kinase)
LAQDEITLTVPRDRQFYPVAHLVLGGLAVRLNLTLESLEDLQVAVDGILDREDASGEITMRVRVTERGLEAELGPFDGDGLRSDLERQAGEELGLRRILDAVVDDVSVVSRDDGAWVVLQKGSPE